ADAHARGEQHGEPGPPGELRALIVPAQADAPDPGERRPDHEHQTQGDHQDVPPADGRADVIPDIGEGLRGLLAVHRTDPGRHAECGDDQQRGRDEDRLLQSRPHAAGSVRPLGGRGRVLTSSQLSPHTSSPVLAMAIPRAPTSDYTDRYGYLV